MIRRQKVDLSEERKVISRMITSTDFLKKIRKSVKHEYFDSSYSQILSRWIIEYYDKFKESPGKNIQEIYANKKKYLRNEEDTELIFTFLSNLSDEWVKHQVSNVEYNVDQAIQFLKLQSLKLLNEKLKNAIEEKNYLIAEQLVGNYSKVEKNENKGVKLFSDTVAVIDAFYRDDEILFRFDGCLGEVAGDFCRGDLAAILAYTNRGKSWWLFHVAKVAAFVGGCNVVFFSLEMTEKQVIRRAWMSVVGSPTSDREIEMPVFEKDEDKWIVSKELVEMKGIDLSKIEREQQIHRMCVPGDIRFITLPAYSSTVNDIVAHIDNLENYENYLVDVVVIDYADIIQSSQKYKEYRFQDEEIWKQLRALAQTRNILIVTGTQTDRKSGKRDADESNVAENIGRVRHVSKMIVLNQDRKEYKNGVMRVRCVKERDDKKSTKEAIVLQCLQIGRPYLDSRFFDEVKKKD